MTPLSRSSVTAPRIPTAVWLLGLGAAAAVAYVGRSLLLPLLLGTLGAYLLNPLVRRLQQRGVARVNAVALVFSALVGTVSLALFLSFSTLQMETRRLVAEAPVFATELEVALDRAADDARTAWPSLSRVIPTDPQPGWMARSLKARFGEGEMLADHAGEMATLLILTPVFAFFLLRDGPPLVDRTIGRIHPRHIETSVAAWAQMDVIIGKYLRGLALESAAVGALSAVGLWALGVPFPLLIGLFAALVNPVPYVGVALSLGLSLLVGLTAHMNVGALGGILGLFVAIRLIDDIILVPQTLGRSVHLHPLVVIVSIVFAEHALGVIGMVLAVPVVTVLKEVTLLLLEHRRTLARAGQPWVLSGHIEHIPF